MVLVYIIIHRKKGLILYTKLNNHIIIIFGLIISNISQFFLFKKKTYYCGFEFLLNSFGFSLIVYIFCVKILIAIIFGVQKIDISQSSSHVSSNENKVTILRTNQFFENSENNIKNNKANNRITTESFIDTKLRNEIFYKCLKIFDIIYIIYIISLIILSIIIITNPIIEFQSSSNELWESKCDTKYGKTIFGIIEAIVLYFTIIQNNRALNKNYTFKEIRYIFICILIIFIFRMTIMVRKTIQKN